MKYNGVLCNQQGQQRRPSLAAVIGKVYRQSTTQHTLQMLQAHRDDAMLKLAHCLVNNVPKNIDVCPVGKSDHCSSI